MKKEFPFSIRVDQEIFDGIEWAKKEKDWNNDSQAGRNILALGIHFLKKSKEVTENPKLVDEINQKMKDFMSTLSSRETIKDVLKTFDDEEIETIFSYSYLEDKQRKLEKEKELKERETAEEIARKREEDAKFRKITQYKMAIKLKEDRWIRIKCFKDINGHPADTNGDEIPDSAYDDLTNLPPGVEYLEEVDQDEYSMFD